LNIAFHYVSFAGDKKTGLLTEPLMSPRFPRGLSELESRHTILPPWLQTACRAPLRLFGCEQRRSLLSDSVRFRTDALGNREDV